MSDAENYSKAETISESLLMLADASRSQEVPFRRRAVMGLVHEKIRMHLIDGVLVAPFGNRPTDTEIIRAAFDDPNDYWGAWSYEADDASFIQFLATHLAKNEEEFRWRVKDVRSAVDSHKGENRIESVKAMLGDPNTRWLIPEGLRLYIMSISKAEEEAAVAIASEEDQKLPAEENHAGPSSASPTFKPKRGPRANIRIRVVNAMKEQIADGELSLDNLANMQEVLLAHRFSASRETVRKARREILGEIPTNSDK